MIKEVIEDMITMLYQIRIKIKREIKKESSGNFGVEKKNNLKKNSVEGLNSKF